MARGNQYNWGAQGDKNPPELHSLDHDLRLMPRSPVEALEPTRGIQPPRRQQRRELRRRKKGSGNFMKLVNGLLTLTLMVMMTIGLLFFILKNQFDSPGPLQHSTIVTIPPGSGLNKIATILQREDAISDSRIFVGSAIYFNAQKKLKAGEYEIRKHASMRQVLDRLVEGKAILQKATIREGLTSAQVVALLNDNDMMSGEISTMPAEGSLLPDTYKFSRNMDRQELIDRMQTDQRRLVKKLWEKRAQGLPLQSPEEAIILASIVERETGRSDERGRVAGVFVNRLKRGMRLQSDPTIIYGLVGGQGSLGRPIRRSELARKTPYNTYQIDGLPPTPIGNPGRAAIEAVLNPADTKDLFFVADGTGGHAFSPTHRGHLRNVSKWRKIERGIRARQKIRRAEQQAVAAASAQAAEVASTTATETTDIPGLSLSSGPAAIAASAAKSGERVSTQVSPVLSERALVRDGTRKISQKVRTGPKVPLPVRRPRG